MNVNLHIISWRPSKPKQCFAGLTIFYKIFLILNMYNRIFHKILSLLRNIVLDLNNVMLCYETQKHFMYNIDWIKPHKPCVKMVAGEIF